MYKFFIMCLLLNQDKNWEVVDTSKNRVDQFKRTMPLIQDMKNHAMRPRHWTKIQTKMQRQFDHTAEDFTLEKIIEYGFDQFAEPINEISGAATKELAIEQVSMAVLWELKGCWEGWVQKVF